MTSGISFGAANFEIIDGFAFESALKVGLDLREEIGNNVRHASTEVVGDGDAIHLCKMAIDTDVAQIAIEKAEADGSAIVYSLQLREALCG